MRHGGNLAHLRAIVGLYVDPPAHAIVLSVDEKSQIQALDRTQPGLSGRPGCVRSKAWIWLFSSTDSTTAWRGGAR